MKARAVLKTGMAVLAMSFIGYVAVNAAPAFGEGGAGRVTAGEAASASASAPAASEQNASAPAATRPDPTSAVPAPSGGNSGRVDAAWAAQVATRTGIPVRAVLGYAGAAVALAVEQPSCHLGWNTLAALGDIESGHGAHAGSSLNAAGVDTPGVFGPALDGGAYARVADSDAGALDGSSNGDRAVGPLQFIPSTWARWGADGNGDGRDDPQQIDDAALAAGRYLCSYGDLSSAQGWRASVFAYNHVDSYVNAVANTANAYAAAAAG